ncbi:RNA recognition motif-containing protein [Babesia ovata]|uniref:RNA recognition motif-containing protein n=1 Tax=Babesia ovata TaxID=189622 RepID=A0A2H6KDK7_9APIC|nr:RNA recognition motif-containing protein [Babesia ovata]GBE61039.1 RNA recognition motif-containing protein [Babesia ovata]
MASNSDVRASQLLDMSLDDVDKVLRRGKATHKGGRNNMRYQDMQNDYQSARNTPRDVRGGYRDSTQPFGFSKNNYHDSTQSFGDSRNSFPGQMNQYGDARNDLRGPSQPFGDPRNHFNSQMQPFGDGRNDFRDHRGGGFYGKRHFNGSDSHRRERFYPQSFGARPLHSTPYGPTSNEPRPPKFIVRVTNLDHSVSQEQLMRLFASVGEVDKLWIDYDRTARSRGTGGCVFKSMNDAKFAIAKYNGMDLSGRPMSVYGEYQEFPRQRPRPQNGNRSIHNVKSPW